MTVDAIIDGILAREGGGTYTNAPSDHGGPTKYGVTQAALAAYRMAPATPEDVQALTEAEARAIYRRDFFVRPGFDKVPDPATQVLLMDWGVNSGPGIAIRALQRLLGVPNDGVLGPQTLLALSGLDAAKLYRRLAAARVRFIGDLLHNDPSQLVYARGWLNRAADFVEVANAGSDAPTS